MSCPSPGTPSRPAGCRRPPSAWKEMTVCGITGWIGYQRDLSTQRQVMDLGSYVAERYREAVAEVPAVDGQSEHEARLIWCGASAAGGGSGVAVLRPVDIPQLADEELAEPLQRGDAVRP